MKIKELFKNIEHSIEHGPDDIDVTGINIDSRLVRPGDLFVATVGRNADGHSYIADAIARGASALLLGSDQGWASAESNAKWSRTVSDDIDPDVGWNLSLNQTVVISRDPRDILSKIVNRFYGDPSGKFNLIGVTGTNGKTSTCALIDHILKKSGHRTGLIGTIANYCADEILEIRRTTPTTPDCVELGEIMDAMVKRGVDDMIMEASSMGLKMGRVSACDFGVAVFTNLSPEHLDDHGTMEDYSESKAILFKLARQAVINADDPYLDFILERTTGKTLFFGINNSKADIKADELVFSEGRISFDASYKDNKANITLDTPSEFAVYNALAAIGAAICSGVSFDDAVAALNERIDIPGRYEVLVSGDGICSIVDYAHTAAALENLLTSVRQNPAYERIISVFGCGGDRDPSKRAPMGEISGRLADYTFITSDNPRTENPSDIIAQIEDGMNKAGAKMEQDYLVIPDRAEAIEMAIGSARPGDAVVIAGKGHEDYQIIGMEKSHFDDREQVRAVYEIRSKGYDR